MTDPFVFVTTHTINDGAREDVERLSREFADFVREHEPSVLVFDFFIDDDGREITNVQLHEDAASMEAHLQKAGQLIGNALALTRTTSIDVYGSPGPVLRTVLQNNVDAGVQVTVKSFRPAGFART